MKNKKITYDNVLNLIYKKASGFYYTEEQLEYEKTQKNKHFDENSKENANLTKNSDMVTPQISMFDDTIKTSNENKKQNEKSENLALVKKKITTHYVSPDMLAIKILLEIFGKEVSGENLSTISDEELINLKNKLVEEIINEDK